MNQEAPRDDGLVEFRFRPWHSAEESWDDFMRAVERGYAQYLDRCHHPITADQTGPERDPAEVDPDD